MTRKKRPSNKKWKDYAIQTISDCVNLQDILKLLRYIDSERVSLIKCKQGSDNKNYYNKELDKLKALEYFVHQYKFLFIEASIIEQKKLINPNFEKSYRYRARFKIKPKDLPNIKGYKLLQKLGYYNKDTNPKGVVMDHRYSIKDGIDNKINPEILGKLYNCEFLTHKENIRKSSNSSITLEELISAA